MLFIKLFLLLIGKGVVEGNTITINSVKMVLNKECTGVAMYSLFLGFCFAYGNLKKIKYCAFGLIMLMGLNVIRLFTLIITTFFGENVFNFSHDFLWPSSFFIFTLIVVIYYIRRVK